MNLLSFNKNDYSVLFTEDLWHFQSQKLQPFEISSMNKKRVKHLWYNYKTNEKIDKVKNYKDNFR